MDPADAPAAPEKPRDTSGRFVAPADIDFDRGPTEDPKDAFLSTAGHEERELLANLKTPEEPEVSRGAGAESEPAAAAETPAEEAPAPTAESAAAPAKEAEEPDDVIERLIAKASLKDPKMGQRLLAVLAGDEPAASAAPSPAAKGPTDQELIDEWNRAVAKGGDFAAVRSLTDRLVDARLAPILRDSENRKAEDAMKSAAVQRLEKFAKANPGWEKYRDAMVKEAGKMAVELGVPVLSIPPETAYRNARASALLAQATTAAAKAVGAAKAGAAKGLKGVPSTAPSGPATKTPITPDQAVLGKTMDRFTIDKVRRNPF